MATIEHLFDPPDRFITGTVGPPGQRAFFVQARQGMHLITVGLEKQQVQILAERVLDLIEEVQASEPGAWDAEDALVDNGPLDQPIDEEFRAGTITLSWDPAAQRVVIEVQSVDDAPSDPVVTQEEDLTEVEVPEPAEALIVRLTMVQAVGFSARSGQVVQAGRPQCQFCGGPIDPEGHLCPRANGFRRRA